MYVNGAVLIEASSERACKTDALAGSSDQACLFAASRSLVRDGGKGAIRGPAEIIGKNCDNGHFASGGRAFYEQC